MHKAEVMDATKTARDQAIALDQRQIEVMWWHAARLECENEKRAKRTPEKCRVDGSK